MKLSKEEKQRRKEERRKIKWNKEHKNINDTIYKSCSVHTNYFPAEDVWILMDDEHFYRNDKNSLDGYSNRCKRCEIERAKKRQQDHREELLPYYRQYNTDNWDRKSQQFRDRRINNLEEWQDYYANWLKTPAGKESSKKAQEKRKHKNHKINTKEWMSCKDYFKNENGEWCCAYCGTLWKDHYRTYAGELQKCDLHKEHVDDKGNNDLSNCVPSCLNCNSSKHTYALEFWYNEDNPDFTQERLDKILKWINEDWKEYYVEKKPRAKYGSRKKVS
jgi:hypothetical protein